MNINETINDFPKELHDKATSLFIETDNSFQRELISAIIITFLERSIQNLDSIIDEWLSLCAHLDKKVTFHYKRKEYFGVFKGINSKGHAQIETDGKVLQFPSIYLR